MRHIGTDPANPGWRRNYSYNEDSLLEAGKKSNRLSGTDLGGGNSETYSTGGNGYDAHGNMLSMPHLQVMQWDFKDRLLVTQRQKVDDQADDGEKHHGEKTYYVYDAGGQRVRKVTERQAPPGKAPTRMKERIYVGGFETYAEYENDGMKISLKRETLHVMDGKKRIALVETKTAPRLAPASLIRYQFGNHLGSVGLELDDQAQIISYEEYAPYGSSTYQAGRSQTEAAKRYRYTGKERDEEGGLNYHGARYYALWIGRWSSADPAGIT